MRIVLEQTPAESTSYRFARLDYQQFFPASARIVKGISPREKSTTPTRPI